MNTERKIAVLVGALFLTATISGLIVVMAWGAVLDAVDPLAEAAGSGTPIKVGVIFEVVMGVAVAAIALAMYPILRRYDVTAALAYVVARAIEGAFIIVPAVTMLTVWTLSESFLEAGSPTSSPLPAAGEAVFKIGDWAGYVAVATIFCLGALVFYTMLYRTRLVPRWLSVWGLLGAVLYLGSGVLVMFGQETAGMASNLPIALNEIVLAFWLIVKGFDAAALADAGEATPSAQAVGDTRSRRPATRTV